MLHDLARARAPARGRACSPRATAPRSTRAARTSTPRSATSRDFLAELLRRRPRGVRRPPLHVLRRRRGRAPVRGRRRPRLDDRRRERDPRPGPRGVADRGARAGTAPQLLLAAVPPRGRVGQAGAHRDRHRPPSGVDPVGRGRGRRRAPRHARRRAGARARRRRDGRRAGVDAAVARRRATSWSRTARSRAPRSSRPRIGGRGDPAQRDRRHARRRRRAAHVDRVAAGARRARRPSRW